MSRRLTAGLAILALAACGAGGSGSGSSPGGAPVVSGSSTTGGVAWVRILNGASETAGSSAAQAVTLASRAIDGVPFGNLSAFQPYTGNSGATFTLQSAAWTAPLVCVSQVTLIQGRYYTLVVAGKSTSSGNQGLQCQLFAESYTTPPAQSALVAVHHASPTLLNLGEGAISFGTFTPPPSTQPGAAVLLSAPIGTATFANSLSQSTAYGTTQAATIATGANVPIGLYFVPFVPTSVPSPSSAPTASPPASPTPMPSATSASSATSTPSPMPTAQATFLPSQAILGPGVPMTGGSLPDTQNLFPFANVNTLSIYIIDAPGAMPNPPFTIVGVFD